MNLTGNASSGWTTGKLGNGLNFDGVNDYVSISDDDSLRMGNRSRTITAWIKVDSHNSDYREIFRRTEGVNDWFILLNNGNEFAMSTSGVASEYDTGYSFSADGNWHFVAGTYDGSTITLYDDGVPSLTVAGASSGDAVGASAIGAIPGGAGQFFNGTIDEVKIYDRVLTSDEIRSAYLSGVNGSVKLYIEDVTGNVGIGTTNPTYLLEVDGNVSLNNTLFVTESGGIGIGTASPANRLHVQSTETNIALFNTSSTTSRIVIDGAGANSGILFKEGGQNKWSLASINEDIGFYNEGKGTFAMFFQGGINEEDYVGIETTNPSVELQVFGGICATGSNPFNCTNTGGGDIKGTGTVSGGGVDLAERFASIEDLEPGTLVSLSSVTVKKEIIIEISNITAVDLDELEKVFDVENTEEFLEKIENDEIISGNSEVAQSIQSIKDGLKQKDRKGVTGKEKVLATKSAIVKMSQKAYDNNLIGVVSTRPGFVMEFGNVDMSITTELIALIGRVPVKVSLENGQIEVGDPLTSANTPGYAMKATAPGKIIGYALESFDEENREDKILVLINLEFYQGPGNVNATVLANQTMGPIFPGHVSFNQDTVGQATILLNSTSVRINFTEEYEVVPIVTVTQLEFIDGQYRVAEKTTKGFVIELQNTQEIEIAFDWHAFAQSAEEIINATNVTNATEINITNQTGINETQEIEINETIENINETVNSDNKSINETLESNETIPGNESVEEINQTVGANKTENNETIEETTEITFVEESSGSNETGLTQDLISTGLSSITGGIIGVNGEQEGIFSRFFGMIFNFKGGKNE